MRTGAQQIEQATWTEEALQRWLSVRDCRGRIVIIANREPFRHERAADGAIVVKRSASGVVTALEPLVGACGGTWVAHGSGSADRETVDRRDTVAVPPSRPTYRLRRVWLEADERRRYYDGFANEGLWPLCHRAGVPPVFRRADFDAYARVNAKFAHAACDAAAGDAPIVLVQDYHFALAPQIVRRRRPDSTIVTFWHIPWPTAQRFAVCPWSRELLRGLLASGTIGFHTADDVEGFLDCAGRLLGADIDWRRNIVSYAGETTRVGAYPISIQWPSTAALASPPVEACRALVGRELGLASDAALVVGVDRLDYIKGLCEKVAAIERLLERHPEFIGRAVFVQIAEPSRQTVPAYRDLRARLRAAVDRVNARFASAAWQPIVLRETHHDPDEVYTFLRAADVCYVGSLHDGMNLVAKEFAAARDDERGVLVLSAFAGAARQLGAALTIDPHAVDATADVLARALRMPAGEQAVRMRALRAVVARFNVYWWIGGLLEDALGGAVPTLAAAS